MPIFPLSPRYTVTALNILFTENQRDVFALVGFGLAILQTLLAIYSFVGPIRLRTQQEIDRATETRRRLVSMLMLFICSEAVIMIICAALWLDGTNWKFFSAIAAYIQMTILFIAGLVILKKSDDSISVALLYSMLLTLFLTISIRYRVSPAELASLDVHNLGNLFRLQLEPLTTVFALLSGLCFLRFSIALARSFLRELTGTASNR